MKKYGIFFIYLIILNFSKAIELDLNKIYSYFVAFLKGYAGENTLCVKGLIDHRDEILAVFEKYMLEGGKLEEIIMELDSRVSSQILKCNPNQFENLIENLKEPDYLKQTLKLLGENLSNKGIIDWTLN